MMDVIGVHQSNEHIDIKKGNHCPWGCIAF
jgi:hypothetical protein